MKNKIVGVKGFNKDMTCRNMQYEEGKIFEEDDIGNKGVCIDHIFVNDLGKETDFVKYENIVKHSPNIIDLIEPGDYVNGMEVLDKYIPRDIWEPIELRVDSKYINIIISSEIKTIVTKELFKNSEYEV